MCFCYLEPVCCLFSVFEAFSLVCLSCQCSANGCLEKLVSEMIYYVWRGNRDVKLYSLTHSSLPYNSVMMVPMTNSTFYRPTDQGRVLSEDSVEGESLGRGGSSPRRSRRCGAGSSEGMVHQGDLMQVLVTAEERTTPRVDRTNTQHHFHLDHTQIHKRHSSSRDSNVTQRLLMPIYA